MMAQTEIIIVCPSHCYNFITREYFHWLHNSKLAIILNQFIEDSTPWSSG